ncbi:methionine adenosyltransferase [Hydrogenothermus marinus]|uniref:S-adenosylmethionine synthetase n=1 Tax=Hydrogenothermus marinus TaxID=133270 RepID=A0A3M0BQI6_9AQUI|nr:methionine adenosyltransferase [Hydrogenothermus marinus]RMA97088.1 S-adenosylmethionine synthetase [Hydrogenothermus marinus]
MANISIGSLDFPKVSEQPVEIVERKGTGHPDTICDALGEELSIALSELYIKECGAIMHHNVDKALLIGGIADPQFGGGTIISPIEIYLTGRAINELNGKRLPVEELAIETAHKWLSENIPNLDISNHVIIHPQLKPGSKDLVELFERFQLKGEIPLANDTSFGTGYAPFDDIETIVYELERALNNKEFKKDHPYVGEDIKIMGVRNGENIRITIAMAFVDKYVKDLNDYKEKKEIVENYAYSIAQRLTEKHVDIFLNTADDEENGSVYITVTGTSAEAGDDGEIGRGNRVNGLITPYRPMSLEAAAGKNPVSHIGKIYNTAAMDMAERIVSEVEEVDEAYVYLVSQIGKPITEPQVCDVKLRTNKDIKGIEEKVRKIAQEEIDNLPQTWKKFLNRHFRLY